MLSDILYRTFAINQATMYRLIDIKSTVDIVWYRCLQIYLLEVTFVDKNNQKSLSKIF